MTKPVFTIDTEKQLMLVRKTGDWDLATDIAYISQLAQKMSEYKGRSFAILVDMRGWRVPEDVKKSPLKTNVRLDRRSQKGECWLLDDPDQANHLLTYFTQVHFRLERTTQVEPALDWLKTMPIAYNLATVEQWLSS